MEIRHKFMRSYPVFICLIISLLCSLLFACTDKQAAEQIPPKTESPKPTEPTKPEPTKSEPTEPTKPEPTEPTKPEPTEPVKPEPPKSSITYTNFAKNLFTTKCGGCHRGTTAPGGWVFDGLNSVKDRMNDIKREVLVDQTMPPRGPLPESEINSLKEWFDNGMPE